METPIIITYANRTLHGYLNDSISAQSLIKQLPVTITMSDWGHDLCGGNLDIKYSDIDVQDGFRNGDLAFWTPGRNFVIFVSGEDECKDYTDNVILGRLTEPQEVLDSIRGTIEITIKLQEG